MATITFDAYTSPWASFDEFVNWEEEPGNLKLLPLDEDLSTDGRSATHSCASPSTPYRDSSPGCGVHPLIVSQPSHGNLQIVDLRDSANPPGDEQHALAVLPKTALLEELPNDSLKFQTELGGITSQNGSPSPGSRTRKSEAAPFSQDPAPRDACPHSLPPQLNDYLDNPRGTYFPPEYDVRDPFSDFSWESDFPDSLPDCPAPPCSESVDTDQVPASPGAGAGVAKSEFVSLRDLPIENFPVFLLGVLIGVAMGSLPGQTSAVCLHPSNSQQPKRSRRHLELCASPTLHRDPSLVGERLVDATPPIAPPLAEPPHGSVETFRSPPSASYSHPPGHEHLAPATPPEPALLEDPSPNGSLQSRAESARTTSQNDNPSPGSGHPTDSVKAKEDEYEDIFHPKTGIKRPSDNSPGYAKRRKTSSARIRIIRVYDDKGREYTWNRRDKGWENDQQELQKKFAECFPDCRNILRSIEVRPGGVGRVVTLEWDSTTGMYVCDDDIDYQGMSVDRDEIDKLVKSPSQYQEVPWPKRKSWTR